MNMVNTCSMHPVSLMVFEALQGKALLEPPVQTLYVLICSSTAGFTAILHEPLEPLLHREPLATMTLPLSMKQVV